MYIKRLQARRCAGASLVEYLVSIAVGVLVGGALLGFSLYTGQSFAGMLNYVDLETQSRKTLDTMIQEIRQTQALTYYTSNKLTFVDYDAGALVYEYVPANGTLKRTKGGVTKTVLESCDNLKFAVFQRTPIEGTFDNYPATQSGTNSDAKVVQMSWTCSRQIKGVKRNTESVQTAKIVIRNK